MEGCEAHVLDCSHVACEELTVLVDGEQISGGGFEFAILECSERVGDCLGGPIDHAGIDP